MDNEVDEELLKKREKIIKATLPLFNKNLFAGTTTSSIAINAKVSSGTLYSIFGNKNNLIKELYFYCRDILFDVINNDLKSDNINDAFIEIWKNLVDFSLENYDILKYTYLYFQSPFYEEQLSDDDKKYDLIFFKELFKDYLTKDEDMDLFYELLSQYLLHYALIIVEQILEHPELENEIKNKAKILLNYGFRIYGPDFKEVQL